MPVVVQFDAPIPDQWKAAVERRLFVQSKPAQVGVWHWYGDDQVLYRPRVYWQPGTVLTVRSALDGLPVGNRFVDTDRAATVTIGHNQGYMVSNKDKTLYAYRDGKLVKSFPVSLGKPSTPTSSGKFVLMSREYSTVFKTSEYTTTAYYDERFTWDGQYLHAAPWSVADQGSTNVSHGCVNLATDNARWIFENSQVGDPLTVVGTEVHLTPGDGWTVWDLDWNEYVAGSALPHPDLFDAPGRADSSHTFG
jgi:lipoprotein-anchoring transpeptidase ErfK/SrfK